MQQYSPRDIEPKWQKIWDETGVYTTDLKTQKPKYMAMSMFNYPSGNLHIGHAMNFTISDVRLVTSDNKASKRITQWAGIHLVYPQRTERLKKV